MLLALKSVGMVISATQVVALHFLLPHIMFAPTCRRRLSIEEQKDPKVAMPPEKVAAQVLSVVNAYFKVCWVLGLRC